MLRSLFDFLDSTPAFYAIVAILATVALIWNALFAVLRESGAESSKSRRLLSAVILFGFLLAWRWPFLLSAHEYNPDESQLLAGALTLARDPVFWRSVDGTTSGPLNFYALLPLHWLGAPLDYFTARLTGLLLVWIALVACARLPESALSRSASRLAVLPAAIFFAAATEADFIHYSSEHVSLALTGVAACLLVCARADSRRYGPGWYAGAVVAGMLPWAKLQSGPIAAGLVFYGLIGLWLDRECSAKQKWTRSACFILAAGVVSAGIGLMAIVTGQADQLYGSYLLQNLDYIQTGQTPGEAALNLWTSSSEVGHYPAFVIGSLVLIGVSLAVGLRQRRKSWDLWLLGAGLTFVSVGCVLAAQRDFKHYLLLTIVPLAVWTGAAAVISWPHFASRRGRWIVTGLFLIAALAPLGARLRHPIPSIVGSFGDHWRHPYTSLTRVIRAYRTPDSSLSVWGWYSSLYVESAPPQGARDTHTVSSINPSPRLQYYRDRFLADIRRSEPDFFVDAVGPGSQAYQQRSQSAHEIFPALGDYVRSHYQMVGEFGYARLYVSKRLLAARGERPPELNFLTEARPGGFHLPVHAKIHATSASVWRILSKDVRMLIPSPAEVVWPLDWQDRVLVIEYGYPPEAYLRGRSSAVEVNVELRGANGSVRPVFHRLLNPDRLRNERGMQSTHIALPPFAPGSEVVLRTSPASGTGNAEDWFFLYGIDTVRAAQFLPEQFPGFSRPPNSADAEQSFVIRDENMQSRVMLQAPATIAFVLDGAESRLSFDYGFDGAAYTGDNRTDGAVFVVERESAGLPPSVLFRRYLRPLSVGADQGEQTAEFALTGVGKGDVLRVRIEPGPDGNAAWDWTYISRLDIR